MAWGCFALAPAGDAKPTSRTTVWQQLASSERSVDKERLWTIVELPACFAGLETEREGGVKTPPPSRTMTPLKTGSSRVRAAPRLKVAAGVALIRVKSQTTELLRWGCDAQL